MTRIELRFLTQASSAILKAKCRCGTDVSLKSSDGRVYGFHIDTLKEYGRFKIPVRPPGPRSKKPPAAIEMAETSDVLVILLNFMHLKKQMDLKNLDFNILLPFARAAEKYKVYPALNICSILLRYVSCDNASYFT